MGRYFDPGTTSPTLIEKLQKNRYDAEAGARWWRFYYPYVVRLYCGWHCPAADADELAGETLGKALLALDRYQRDGKPASFRRWVFAIARNSLRERKRRGARNPIIPVSDPLDPADDVEKLNEPDDLGEEPVEARRELIRIAYELVRENWKGEPETLSAFEEVIFNGLKPAQTAIKLGRPAKFVHQAVWKVRNKLAKVLAVMDAFDEQDEI